MARLGHAPWYFNCSRTRHTHVPLYKGHKLFLETRTILQRINCFSCTYLTAHPMPYIFLCLTFSCALHFLMAQLGHVWLTFSYGSTWRRMAYIFLWLNLVTYGLHFLMAQLGHVWLTFSYGSTWRRMAYIFFWLNVVTYGLHFLMAQLGHLWLTFSSGSTW